MRVLTNVTSSLMSDYNELIECLVRQINGDAYFDATLIQNVDKSSISYSDFDLFVTFMDDDLDVLDNYYEMLDYATKNNKINNFLVYYKSKPFYNTKEVYFTKKNANHNRLHRFMEYAEIDEVVFDLAVHAAVYFGADINVKHGMLRYMNYDIIDLGAVRMLANNTIINSYYSKIIVAREEEQSLIVKANIENTNSLLEIEKVHSNMDKLYLDLDRYLEYAVDFYKEIIYSFTNHAIKTLDYIFVKEYFDIGHLSSIASCFNRAGYKTALSCEDSDFDDTISIYKMVVYALSFAENNEFVLEIWRAIFNDGKQLELRCSRDNFFYFNSYELSEKLLGKADIKELKQYIALVEGEVLKANDSNIYKAYITLSNYYYNIGDVEKSIDSELKALKVAPRAIDKAMSCKVLFERYKLSADSENATKYIAEASKYYDLMLGGYFNDYAKVIISIINSNTRFDGDTKWKINALNAAKTNVYLDRDSYYLLCVRRLIDYNDGMSREEILTGLKDIVDEMISNFFIKPTSLYVSIYNCLLVMAKMYEEDGDMANASMCYKRAYVYLGTIEEVSEGIEEDMAYVQYKLGDTAISMDSAKSYKQLSKADKRSYQYIIKTGKYVEFYADLLLSINERYIEDKRYRVAGMVARNNLTKLISIAEQNNMYYKDIAHYTDKMSKVFAGAGMVKYSEEFAMFADNYSKIAATKIDEDAEIN